MRQERFVAEHEADWRRLEALLDRLDGRRGEGDPASLPRACRRVSQQLALATQRGYSPALVERLHELALRSHLHLYRPRLELGPRLRALLRVEVPRAVRREWPLVLLGHLLLYGPALAAGLAVVDEPSRVYLFLDPLQVETFEEMYDPQGEHFLRERAAGSDLEMFGFYIWNNVGIGFRTFASGALLGLGPVFFMATNGLHLGAVAAHLVGAGLGVPFSSFVIGHGSFELTAIVLAGAAGSRLGLGLLAPGPWPRAEALRRAAARALPVLEGAAILLVGAAVIEAFWSSSTLVPVAVKYAVGAALWLLVYGWLLLGGRAARR